MELFVFTDVFDGCYTRGICMAIAPTKEVAMDLILNEAKKVEQANEEFLESSDWVAYPEFMSQRTLSNMGRCRRIPSRDELQQAKCHVVSLTKPFAMIQGAGD